MHLFTYGTLMFAEIWHQVTGLEITPKTAQLDGYQRYRLQDRMYPGMILKSGESVVGQLYSGLSAQVFDKLDAFEGSDYLRVEVLVNCGEESSSVPCFTYLIRESQRKLLSNEIWEPSWFLAEGYQKFVSGYEGFDQI